MGSSRGITGICARKTARAIPAATLCVILLFLLLPSWTMAASPRVICVPQVPSDLLIPHDTWSGEPTLLKGVAKGSNLIGGTYYWDFGDGNTSAPSVIANPDDLSATHTYAGNLNDLIVATLHVTGADGDSASDEYRIVIREQSLDVEINKSIDDGLWWLYANREAVGDYTIIPSDVLTTPDGDPGLQGEYFNNTSHSGDPSLVRIDSTINFDWNNDSPGPGVSANFSVRWTGTLQIPADGMYAFASHNDDGTRLYVDGNQLIDDWTGHGPLWKYSKAVYLTAGEHTFQVDFYDGSGNAQARIYWAEINQFRWRNDGYSANSTASAVQAFEINGHLETGDPNEDPYVDAVRSGIDYLMTTLITQTMSLQSGENPDSNNNGIGLSVNSSHAIYELGAVMDALVASGTPDALTRTGGANVLGRSYQDIVQDMVDMYAWGMDDSLGGWRYAWNREADNSASQWAAIGMIAAERHFGCVVPGWVKERNKTWLLASRNADGGFGYNSRGYLWGYAETRIAETASGMVQLTFDNITTDDPLWIGAQNVLDTSWNSLITFSYDSYYAWYAIAKAMRLALPEEIIQLPSGLDWYGDNSKGLARTLVNLQQSNGSWSQIQLPGGYLRLPLTTAWSTIILSGTLFDKPPVANIQAQPNPGALGQTIYFDASGSYHVDPAKEIIEYQWDFDASDGVDFEFPDATGPMVEHAYGDLGDYTVTVKVMDNSSPSRFDIGTYTVQITVPPHPPTASIGGPYLATVGETVQVDGSGSYDIDEPLGDAIITWEWEADFVAPYDFNETSGQIAALPSFATAGRHDIALKVTDNTATIFPTADSPDLTHVDYGEVIVYEAGVTDLYARPKATKCQLRWTHIDAPLYEILRSESGPNSEFELIGTTGSTYSTYIDYNVVMYKDYWYRIRSEINGETMLSGPVHIYSAGRIRNRPPVITSQPPLTASEQVSYTYDVQANDPEGTRLTYLLDSGPAGMDINAATGQITWTPTHDQIGVNDIMIRVNDARRASASQFFQAVVNPRPNTAPMPDPKGPYSGLVGESLAFTGSAVDPEGDPIVEYRWVFGDGNEAYGQNVTHTYTAQSAYVVSLHTTDDRGATGHAVTKCLTGLANRPPIADAGGPYYGEINQPITIDGSGSYDPDNDVVSYTWYYDTVTGSQSGVQADFTFDAVGVYVVTLSIVDGRGGSDTTTVEINVTPPNEPPVSVLTSEAFLWNNLTFDGTGSFDPEGSPLTAWEWDFGDGVITTGAMVSHQYATEGDFTVRLTVTDDKGATGYSEHSVSIVHPTPNNSPDIDAGGPYTKPLGSAITLTAAGADPDGDSVIFTWTYDGQDRVGQTVQLSVDTFDTIGTYEVLLTATDGSGGTAADTAQVIIFDPATGGTGTPDETPPETIISSPSSGSLLNGMVNFTGTVNDDNLVSWVLEYAPEGTEQWQTINEGNTNVDNGFLGQLDAGLLQDDLYRVRLRAQDSNYSVNTWNQYEVNSPLKLGQFSLEYIDLEMALAGLPIKVIRRYDTRDVNDLGDFGYGWKLGAVDPQIRETIPVNPLEETLGFFVAEPYRTGTRIYLTDPDGKRIGFTFEPTPKATLLGTSYIPKFTPDPGVHDTLEVDPIALTLQGDGSYVFFLIGFNYNPSDFRLIRKDGTTYHYSQFNGLDKIADRNNNELDYRYDGIVHSSGQSVQFERDSEGRITKITDPEGKFITYVYDGAGNLSSMNDQENLTSSYGYFTDPAHYLETITDSQGHTAARYEYDTEGRVTAFTNALGDRSEQTYDPAAFSGTFTDARGNVTEIFYDAQGNIIRKVDPLGGELSFTWDADKNKTSETDKNGNTTHFTYDDRGNVLSKTDAMGIVTNFTYNAFNAIVAVTDSTGRTTTTDYDSKGNMTGFTNPAGQTATFTYGPSGRLTSLTDFSGNLTTYEYTAGVAPPTRIISTDGTIREYTYFWNGQIKSLTDELGNTSTRSYDDSGRLVQETDALGNTTEYEYNGHLETSKTCCNGNITNYGYDDANHIISQTDQLGETTHFTYDGNGNRLSIKDPAGNTTRFVYDALDRLVTKIDPLNMRTNYTYDPAGNLVEKVDRNTRRTLYTYDVHNQLVRETWLEGTTTINVIDYGYDEVGNQSYVADHFSSLLFTYDKLNNLLTADNTGTPGVPSINLSYSYDSRGNRISVEDSLGVRSDSTYDSRKRLLSRTWQGAGMANSVRVEFAYNARGDRNRVDRFTDVSGVNKVGSSSYTYDAASNLTTLRHNVINSGVSTVADYNYTYNGNAASLLNFEAHHGQTFEYDYDDSGQLTGSIRSAFSDEAFTYEANGNPADAGYTIGGNNRIMSDSNHNYDYDAEGNIISKTEIATGMVTTFAYDHRNRLTRVEKHNAGDTLISTVSYTYDALDRRIKTSVDGQVTYMVYDGENVWADFDAFANLETRYMFDDRPDSLIARSKPGVGPDWYLTDKLGTVRDLVDSNGTLLNHVDYDSFGRIHLQTDVSQGDRYLFTGREYNDETGLYYYRGRYYDPGLGRFISEDPIGFKGGDFNLYRYVNNSPLNGIDPTGEASIHATALIYACSSIKAVQVATSSMKLFLPPLLAVRDVLKTGKYTKFDNPTWTDKAVDLVFDTILDVLFKPLPISPQKCGIPDPAIEKYKELTKWALNNIWFPKK